MRELHNQTSLDFEFEILQKTKQGHLIQQLQIRTKVESPCDHLQRGGSVTLQR